MIWRGLVLLSALPGWLFIRFSAPRLPRKHPWHGRKFSLDDWAYGRTTFTKQFDLVMWSVVLGMVFCFLRTVWYFLQ